MGAINKDKARFDTRLSLEQKQLFEKAALLGGYRSLTDFIIVTVQEKAREILEESERIIASERDKELFFDSLENPPVPNLVLKHAKDEYEKMLPKK